MLAYIRSPQVFFEYENACEPGPCLAEITPWRLLFWSRRAARQGAATPLQATLLPRRGCCKDDRSRRRERSGSGDPHDSAARRSLTASASDEILVRAPAEEEEVMFARVSTYRGDTD